MLNKIVIFFSLAVTTIVLAESLEGSSKGLSSLLQFDHHVIIQVGGDNAKNCSGSIIKNQWILTSATCVEDATELKILFKALNPNAKQPFSIILDSPETYAIPKYYDDIALLKLPINLIYGDNVIGVSLWTNEFLPNADLGIMPGIDASSDFGTLSFAQYKITDGTECDTAYGDTFDSSSQICVIGYPFIRNNIACDQASGASLLLDWPKNPVIIGVYTLPTTCNASAPFVGVFTYVGKYATWIAARTNKTPNNLLSANSIFNLN